MTLRRLAGLAVLCAWVLWGGNPNFWVPAGGFKDLEACQTNLAVKAIGFTEKGKPWFYLGSSGISVTSGKDTYFLVCLPDTIDPRSPQK